MSGNEKDDRVDGASPEEQLIDALERYRRNIELDLRVSAPARVIAYDPATQTATVRLELMPVPIIAGEEVPTPAPPLYGVPVAWPGGTAGYVSTPLLPNDPGKVTFTDRCLSTWLQTGNPAAPVDPINGRTHNLADAVFEPGLRPLAEARTPTDQTATVVEGPLMRLGYGAASPIPRGDSLVAAHNAYAQAITTAANALNAAAQTYFAIPAPTPPQQAVFATAWAAYATAISTAQTTLATALAAALSVRSFTV